MNRHFILKNTQMPNMYMNNFSSSRVIRNMKVQVAISYHFTPTRMAKIQNMNSAAEYEQAAGGKNCGDSHSHWWGCRQQNYFGRQSSSFLQISTFSHHKIQQVCSSAFTHMNQSLRLHENLHISVSSNWGIVVRTSKQLRCPSACEWFLMNCEASRQWDIFSGLKRDALSIHEKSRNFDAYF